MKAHSESAIGWRNVIAAAGLDDPAKLLRTPPDEAGLTGTLERLSKTGLVGRERWRW